MIICWMSTMWWFHSPCYWNVWVFSSSFWFIFNHLCTNHYHASSTVFFSPLNVYFLLLTMCVHSLAMCASHNNSSVSSCTWLRFFISSTHHSLYTFVISWFVANDNFFVLGLLCCCWLSFCSHESSLHRVLT
jgi:hypothetical protein